MYQLLISHKELEARVIELSKEIENVRFKGFKLNADDFVVRSGEDSSGG